MRGPSGGTKPGVPYLHLGAGDCTAAALSVAPVGWLRFSVSVSFFIVLLAAAIGGAPEQATWGLKAAATQAA